MIFLLHGDNFYELSKALDELIDEYKKKGLSIEQKDGQSAGGLDAIFGTADAMSFFSEAKCLVIKRIFSNKKSSILNEAEQYLSQHKDLDIIFWEDKKADKRTKLYKLLSKKAVVREYAAKNALSLKPWIFDILKKDNIQISSSVLEEFLFKGGSDQAILATELNKLVELLKAENRNEITHDDLRIISENREATIWEFIDSIVERKHAKSLTTLDQMVKDKTDYIKNVGMIVRQLRILALAEFLIRKGATSRLSELGIPPFAMNKLKSQLAKFDADKIKMLYSKLVNLDLSIKEGKIDEKLGLTLYILSF